MSKTAKLSKSNFQFMPSGFGYYKVTYTSPSGRIRYMASLSVVSLRDVLDVDKPKLVDLDALRWYIKNRGIKLD